MRIWLAVIAIALGLVVSGAALAQQGRQESRLAGLTRIDTAIEIAQRGYPEGASTAYLSSSQLNPDAQVGASLNDGPVLLAPPCGPIPEQVLAEIDRLGANEIVGLGGTAVLAQQVVEQAVDGETRPHLACPGTIPWHDRGLRLQVEEVASREFVVTLTNERDQPVEWARQFVLERRSGAGFDPLDPPVGPFTAESHVLRAGDSVETNRFGPTVPQDGEPRDLQSGDYRLTKTIEGVHLGVEFTVN